MIRKDSRKILVIGSTVTDLVAQTDSLPLSGQTIFGKKFFMAPGGKGANQAAVIARLNGDVSFVSKTGVDYFGDFVIDNLKDLGVDTTRIIRDKDNHSGVSLICLLKNGENAIIMNPGANMALSVAEIDNLENLFEVASIILIQLEIPVKTVERILLLSKKHDCLTILDPAPAVPLPDIIYAKSNIITPNEHELESLAGTPTETIDEIFTASCKLIERGVSHVICTKSDGAYMTSRGKNIAFFPGIKVDAVDTTGAGDAFAGALAYMLAAGKNIDESIKFANITAGLSVTRYGAMPSFPHHDEVLRFMNEHN
jgi:ribokinase